ncbi:MAG: M4 family metallopeptidase [Clostridiales bacterium]|nr:M4 family metallopeptidase [Clostridiales bacterium]
MKKHLLRAAVSAVCIGIFISALSYYPNIIRGGSVRRLNIDAAGGVVRLVNGDFGADAKVFSHESALDILDGMRDVYGFGDARGELAADGTTDTAYGRVYKFRQVKDGVSVFGRSISVAADAKGGVLCVSGNYLKDIPSFGEPTVNPADAVSAAVKEYGGGAVSAGLTVYSLDGVAPARAFEVVLQAEDGYRVFVSAESGEILAAIPLTPQAKLNSEPVTLPLTDYYDETQNVTVEKSLSQSDGEYTYYLADALRNIYLLDANHGTGLNNAQQGAQIKNTTGDFGDKVEVSAFINFVKAFDFYADGSVTGAVRRGIDNSLDAVHDNENANNEIRVTAAMHWDTDYQNAAYVSGFGAKSAVFIFGDGLSDGKLYNPAAASDVVGHEYQHAITDHVTPSGLVYLNASGAINEAVSDIFGALIEGRALTDDGFWIMGEDVVPNASPTRQGLRSMKNPTAYGHPAHTDDQKPFVDKSADAKEKEEKDQGGVHSNCNILTHAQYKMYAAAPTFFTRESIGKLWYGVLPLLSANATFEDFRALMMETARSLGWSADIRMTIAESFTSSGINGDDDGSDSANTHMVVFKSEGTTLKSETVAHGGAATAPSNPAKEPDAQYTYAFSGWDKPFDNVTEDLTVNAVFNEVSREYTVIFMSGEQELKRETVLYGRAATAPADPLKATDAQYIYTFLGWDADFGCVTENLTVNAGFALTPREYTIIFIVDGQEYDRQTVLYGEPPAPPADPKKAGYVFTGWFTDAAHTVPLGDAVYGDVSVYAGFGVSLRYAGCFGLAYGAPLSPATAALAFTVGAIAVCMLKRRGTNKDKRAG